MKISVLERAKEQNPVLRNSQTTITHHYIQIFDGEQYLFVEYETPLGKNTSIHTTEEHISDYIKWQELMKIKAGK